MFEWLFGKKILCMLCGTDKMGERPGIVKYFVEGEMMETKICTDCSDDLSSEADETMRDLSRDPQKDYE